MDFREFEMEFKESEINFRESEVNFGSLHQTRNSQKTNRLTIH